MRREAHKTSGNSGKIEFLVPKLPPMSSATTCTDASGTPSIPAISPFWRTTPPLPACSV
jgi:hypothetical protein